MNLRVTGGAVLIARAAHVVERRRLGREHILGLRVALEAQRPNRWSHEHLGVVGPVRLVTGLAIADLEGGVFEDKRPLLFGVAGQAGLFAERSQSHLAAIEAGVRLMAVDAAHRAFHYPVMKRF